MNKLNLQIIEKYNLEKRSYRPDYDDMGYEFTLPSGFVLNGLFVCNGHPTELDTLEGSYENDYICITTEEELQHLISLSWDETLHYIKFVTTPEK